MGKQKRLFAFLSFSLSLLIPSCTIFGLSEAATITTDNYLEVDLTKREYFVNETVDLSDCIVKGVDYETGDKKEVNYTIRWANAKQDIRQGDILSITPGKYRWVFSSEGYKNYSIEITIYEAMSESFYISSYPIHQYYYANSPSSTFSGEGLVAKRLLTYETLNGQQLKKIYDVPLSACSFSYRNNNRNIPLTKGYMFPEGTKGVYTISVTAPSFLFSGKQTAPATYKINVTDSAVSSSLSLEDFDESTIVKYDTDETITLTITNNEIDQSRQTGTENYISPSQVDNSFGFDYFRTKNDEEKIVCPSIGDVPVLVIPFYFNNSKSHELFTDENLSIIEKCFFGNSDDLYYESLRSFYYKSSYGLLNFYGQVAPPFNPQIDGSKSYKINFGSDGLPVLTDNDLAPMLKDAVSYVKKSGFDLRDFDSNGDGYIDALWFVSFNPISPLANNSHAGWPHTNNLLNTTPNVSEPVVNMFAWTPIGTLNDDFYKAQKTTSAGTTGQNSTGDAHSIIHETGHLLGLSDYYSVTASSDAPYVFQTKGNSHVANYAPLGGLDFMDKNFLDHNPYSKLLLGWTKPYLVYGKSTITLKPSLYKNQVVVIPYDSLDYSSSYYKNSRGETKFIPYDEYLVIDFFTPESNYPYSSSINDNLNTKGYDVYSTQNFTNTGVRIYHVDKRGLVYSNNEYVVPSDPVHLISLGENELLACPITNTEYGEFAEHGSKNRNGAIANIVGGEKFANYCDEIRILTVDNEEYVDSSYYLKSTTSDCNSVLFKSGSSFEIGSYTTPTTVMEYPSRMKENEKRNSLSCFGFLSSLVKDLSPEELNNLYYWLEYNGPTQYYTSKQWSIIKKRNSNTALDAEETTIFNSLLVPAGFGNKALFNNGSKCSYQINIS